jgi:hypothetical protein
MCCDVAFQLAHRIFISFSLALAPEGYGNTPRDRVLNSYHCVSDPGVGRLHMSAHLFFLLVETYSEDMYIVTLPTYQMRPASGPRLVDMSIGPISSPPHTVSRGFPGPASAFAYLLVSDACSDKGPLDDSLRAVARCVALVSAARMDYRARSILRCRKEVILPATDVFQNRAALPILGGSRVPPSLARSGVSWFIIPTFCLVEGAPGQS